MASKFKDRIRGKKAKVAVIGQGYVGLPLAVEFAKKGFKALGVDLDKKKVDSINSGVSYILDIPSEEIKPLVKKGMLSATSDYSKLNEVDAIIICVPTPLRKTKDPDMSFIVSAAEAIAKNLRKGQVIVLESTTYPGTTEEVILPMLEATGLKVGRDFSLGFSPERIDPGNPRYMTHNIPKVVSGMTKECRENIALLYSQIVGKVITVSSVKVAEMVKLLENTFRSVNIGLVNELALMCDSLKVDVWEIIEAAKTKPFGFMPFYPGPGLGGHCIPIDPIYLAWKARIQGFEPRFIDLASKINADMPEYVAERVSRSLNKRFGKAVKGAKVLIIGLSYKKDVTDTRESPAYEVIEKLRERGAAISYYDPFVPVSVFGGHKMRSIKLSAAEVRKNDCVVIVTDHSNVDYSFIVNNSKLVIDTRNALRNIVKRDKIERL
ncbi:MAG: nucleotide sugar dehydrogenase [Candidatus Omnitrophica bacterium]|jgi:UDP-N-acetyl-D-glucosamine dehydrogenase|nr:nucleotide sugar dehydrogenase [Candidatus Omnitrophota bacterium]